MKPCRVALRARHVGIFKNYNFWVEIDGRFLFNALYLEDAEEKANWLSYLLGDNGHYIRRDFWKNKADPPNGQMLYVMEELI